MIESIAFWWTLGFTTPMNMEPTKKTKVSKSSVLALHQKKKKKKKAAKSESFLEPSQTFKMELPKELHLTFLTGF